MGLSQADPLIQEVLVSAIRTTSVALALVLLAGGCNDDDGGPASETCGGTTCKADQRCCGPPACGFCVPRDSRIACAERCPVDAGPRPELGPGEPCGDGSCDPGYRCCGPVACGFCIPEAATGISCHTVCPDR
jgi:hypothetical protein